MLVLPWFAAIVAKSGDSFFVQALGHDMLEKVTSGQEAHGAPPGLYLLLFWVTFWPGSILAGLAAPTIWMARREPGARFLLAWLIPSWIVFEVVVTKLPHYVLPLYPAIAILIAGIVEGRGLFRKSWLVRGTVGWFLFPAVIAIMVPVGFFTLSRDLGLVAWPFAAAAVIFGLFAWWLYEVDGAERALLRGMVSSIFVGITVYAVMFPMLPALFPSALVVMALMVRVGFLFVAVSLPGLFASFIKNVIGRARPGVGGSVNPNLFDPFHWTPAWAGLPSGHTTAAFAIMAAFATLFPRARTYLLIYALLIAVSRVVVKAHYPTDAAAGALVGIVGVLLVRRWFALQRLGFSILPDGTLAQYPGPSLRRIKSVARTLLA